MKKMKKGLVENDGSMIRQKSVAKKKPHGSKFCRSMLIGEFLDENVEKDEQDREEESVHQDEECQNQKVVEQLTEEENVLLEKNIEINASEGNITISPSLLF